MANVLAVFAHPDDEVLGCGGTLAKHAEAGDQVDAIVLCRQELRGEFAKAAEILGVSRFRTKKWPDQQLDRAPFTNLVGSVTNAFVDEHGKPDPDVIYTHHPGDLNLDHALTARAVLTAFRPKPGVKPCTILACEVLSSTEYTYPRVFQPNWYVGLDGKHAAQAQDALLCYTSELNKVRSPNALELRTMVRGREIGVEYAEAFQLLRGGPF